MRMRALPIGRANTCDHVCDAPVSGYCEWHVWEHFSPLRSLAAVPQDFSGDCMTRLYDSLTVIHGLVISKWSRAVFVDMRRGGLTVANSTCSIWEGFIDTMRNIAQWKRWFADNADLIAPVRTTADIRRAKAERKTGIILGFQNTSALEDQIGYVSLFKDLGVGVMQITYNTQNLAGAGCCEPHDSGLSGFGREVVAQMNRVGVLCDLSHVGSVTSRDVILASNRPVAYTHILPAALKAHPRNKSDEEIRFIAERGGFVGVTMFPPFLARGNEATVEDYVAAIDYVIRIAGEHNVGIGTDFTQDQEDAFFEYICHDQGYGWRVTGPLGEVVNPAGIRTLGDFPNLTTAMEHAGWPEAKIRKVMGENWLRLLGDVWGE
jgi:membrane dipeptidase